VGVEAEGIPLGWMDDMVKRLLMVLNSELIRLETAEAQISEKKGPDGEPPPHDLDGAERRTRLAKQMQTSLEKLMAMEEAGAKKRKPKVVKSDEEAVAEIERRLAQLVNARLGTGGDR
jgi:hypothetical protein